MSHSQVTFSGFSTYPDLLRSSSNGGIWVPLKTIGRARFGTRRRHFTVYGKIGSADQDPDVKGDVLTHLSYFKPLKRSCSKLFWILRNPSCCVMMTKRMNIDSVSLPFFFLVQMYRKYCQSKSLLTCKRLKLLIH